MDGVLLDAVRAALSRTVETLSRGLGRRFFTSLVQSALCVYHVEILLNGTPFSPLPDRYSAPRRLTKDRDSSDSTGDSLRMYSGWSVINRHVFGAAKRVSI